MGMDVYGKNPKSDKGSYFRANVWYWHPLWNYCEHILPEITSKVEYAHSNDGDGLESVDARKLGFALLKSLREGVAEKYINSYITAVQNAPDEPCWCTSYLKEATVPFPKDPQPPKSSCTSCKGTGLMPNFVKNYFINIETISDFSEFLLDCGGFQIC